MGWIVRGNRCLPVNQLRYICRDFAHFYLEYALDLIAVWQYISDAMRVTARLGDSIGAQFPF
ncbi:hypothetical protein [Caballeronia novacaledonica]|uniref:Uncharacterized protein n=1 Tax=Caballeronia novacaledonica TaxID=1544861 RepID=A0AA37IAG5_9BURK|nr:hypothetical protein [Caballeronia novacaledonica]GJH23021.1 hypothetical protein CBA19CS42_00915 [Caballeronia novacaledonica]